MAHENEYATKKDLVIACINTINESLIETMEDITNDPKE
jgi:hypothetical protein